MINNKLTVLVLLSGFFILTTCRKVEKVMMVTTGVVNNISTNSAEVSAQSVDLGEGATSQGHCYSKTSNVTINTSIKKTDIPARIGSFTSQLTNLDPETKYYIKAYLSKGAETVYGKEISFNTLPVSQLSLTGIVVENSTPSVLEMTFNLTLANIIPAASAFSVQVNSVTRTVNTVTIAGTKVLLTLASAVVYGDIVTVSYTKPSTNPLQAVSGSQAVTISAQPVTNTTLCSTPSATTNAATNIGTTIVTLNATINANGFSTTVTFEYGTTTSYGSSVTATPSPVAGNSNVAVSAGVTGLTPNTLYHFRVKAVNCGTTFGNDLPFNTLCLPPSANSDAATLVTNTTASLNGSVNAAGCSTVVTFEYGLTTSYGLTATAIQSPVIGTTLTSVSAGISGLISGQTYHYRVKAVSSGVPIYGVDIVFTTSISDIVGNIYKTVTIGSQVWMAENLKTGRYNDGALIPLVSDNTEWTSLSTPGYCWYNNDAATYKDTYGALYNWYAVDVLSNGGKNLCPTGWHVPFDAEWTTLTTLLGGPDAAGGRMKEAGTLHWTSPNEFASNSSGFTGLPGSYRDRSSGLFVNFGTYALFWSSTEVSITTAWGRGLYNLDGLVYIYDYPKNHGFSVRCIKD